MLGRGLTQCMKLAALLHCSCVISPTNVIASCVYLCVYYFCPSLGQNVLCRYDL